MCMKDVNAPAFFNDPRVEQAKNLIAKALAEHSAKITEVKPTPSENKQE